MKNSLIETNPYLKNPVKRSKALVRNVTSSSAIEGIRVVRDAKTGRFVSKDPPARTTAPANSSR